jgi:hypothetical protein
MVVVLVGQMLHETDFVFGTYQAFVNTDFLIRGVVMPNILSASSTRGWYFAQRLYPTMLMRWKKHSKWEKQCLVNIFPKHGVAAWEQKVDQYDAMVGFLMMPIFRI